MMRSYKSKSISSKLRRTVGLTSAVLLLSVLVSNLLLDGASEQEAVKKRLQSAANLVAQNSAAALYFNDVDAASQAVANLDVISDIRRGILYDNNGAVYAAFTKEGIEKFDTKASLSRPVAPLANFIERSIKVPVTLDDEVVGSLYIESGIEGFRQVMRSNVRVAVAIFVIISLVSLKMSKDLRRKIVDPITSLATDMANLAEQKDFSVRAKKFDDDETGELVDGFNHMLEQIQQRDASLVEHQKNLETKVEQRTQELSEVLDQLQGNMQQLTLAKEEAESASRAKSEFLANMSHEIRTPINGVLGMTELIQNTPMNDKQHYFAATIHTSAKSLLNIINDILDFSKIEAGSLSMEAIPFHMGNLLEDCAAILAGQAHQKNIELITDIPADQHMSVIGDPHRLRQILNNFLSNAIKFTETGQVVASVRSSDHQSDSQRIDIQIADTGIGMSEDSVEQIFESFKQADGSTTRLYGGTGLGLSITKQLVELMGGSIDVQSTEGLGSTFTFSLTLPTASRAISADEAQSSFDGLHVLIVDDNETNRDIISNIASAWKMSYATADDGISAINTLGSPAGQFLNLVLLDQNMPHMDGISVARWINKNRPDLPVVMLSSIDGVGAETADLGCVHAAITKPVRQTDLYNSIDSIFSDNNPTKHPPIANSVPDMSSMRHASIIDSSTRLLVAEDNLINQEVVLGMLDQTRCHIELVENGALALEQRFKQPYDLILMDCQMPVLDGYAATQAIRKRELEENVEPIPIIALTANALKGDREKCIDAGMDDFLSKPFEQEDLFRIISAWLPQKELGQEQSIQETQSIEHYDSTDNTDSGSGPCRRLTSSIDVSSLDKLRALQRPGQPDIIEKIIGSFLQTAPMSMADIQQAFIDGDAIKIHQLTHPLKTSAAAIGANDLAALVSDLDDICRQGSIAGCSALIHDIEEELELVLEELPEHIKTKEPDSANDSEYSNKLIELPSSSTQPTALVVDDDSNMRMIARAALESVHFEVFEASGGEQAIKQFENTRIDLILLDVEMPGLSGFDVCAAIRANPNGEQTPIIMMTGRDDVEAVNRAYDLGATDFTSKPIHPELLCQRVLYIHRAHQTMQSVKRKEQRLTSAQQVAKLGYWEWDKKEQSMYVSDELLGFFGLEKEDYEGDANQLLKMLDAKPRDIIIDLLESGTPTTSNSSLDLTITDTRGSKRHLQQRVELVNNNTALLATVLDITEKKQAESKIFNLANLDAVTGLPNRNLLVSQLDGMINRYRRDSKPFAIVTVQFCELRRVRETYGVNLVQALVRSAVERLQQDVRSSDILHRSNGADAGIAGWDSVMHLSDDEFVVLLPELRKPSDAASLADRLADTLTDSYDVDEHTVFLYAKAGIVLYPENGQDSETLLRNSTAALKQAKDLNAGNYHFYSEEQNDKAVEILTLESELRKAMRGQPFQLFYQPKVKNATLQPYGAEALIRWIHPEQGFISPATFIPLAEDMGLMADIGTWVLREAIRQLAEWNKQGINDLVVSVNIAPQQMTTTDLPAICSELLTEFRVEPKFLELEITEGSLIEDVDHSIETLAQLKNIGISIALDDFGTGYSSLSYLKKFWLDVLKIDQSFIRDLLTEPQDAAIVESTINLAHRLGMTVVAEGVEEIEHLQWLTERGCDATQGYYFSPPLNPEKFEAWLSEFTAKKKSA
ncbi:MAG: EAL domain-containing protein [Pseudomonadales bacterium]